MWKGLALSMIVLVAACSQSGAPAFQGGWIKPSNTDVDHAARIAFSTRATCRERDDSIHDSNESTYA